MSKNLKNTNTNKINNDQSYDFISEGVKFLDRIEYVLKEIASYDKWMASISIFLITISLTILALKSNINILNKITIAITLALFLSNLFLCWRFLQNYIYNPVIKTLSQTVLKIDKGQSLSDIKNIYGKFGKITGKYRILIDVTFYFGFLFFIAYILGIIF